MNTPPAPSPNRPIALAIVAGVGLALLAGNLFVSAIQAQQIKSLAGQVATLSESLEPLSNEVAKLRATVEMVSADTATLMTSSGSIQAALEKVEGQVQKVSAPIGMKPVAARQHTAKEAAVNNLRAVFRSLVARQWLREPVLGQKPVELMVGINQDGSISSVTVVGSSGSSEFDRSVVEAVHRVDYVPDVRALDREQYQRHFALQRYAFSTASLNQSR